MCLLPVNIFFCSFVDFFGIHYLRPETITMDSSIQDDDELLVPPSDVDTVVMSEAEEKSGSDHESEAESTSNSGNAAKGTTDSKNTSSSDDDDNADDDDANHRPTNDHDDLRERAVRNFLKQLPDVETRYARDGLRYPEGFFRRGRYRITVPGEIPNWDTPNPRKTMRDFTGWTEGRIELARERHRGPAPFNPIDLGLTHHQMYQRRREPPSTAIDLVNSLAHQEVQSMNRSIQDISRSVQIMSNFFRDKKTLMPVYDKATRDIIDEFVLAVVNLRKGTTEAMEATDDII